MPSKCLTCGGQLRIGGPIYNARLHSHDFVTKLQSRVGASTLGTKGRIAGVLRGISDEEWLAHKPLSFDFNAICSQLKIPSLNKQEIIAGFRSLNFMVNQTYYNPDLWKTNAPPEVVYDIFKQFKKERCTAEAKDMFRSVSEASPTHRILSKPILHKPNFDVEAVKMALRTKKAEKKYFTPTEKNWGPKSKAI